MARQELCSHLMGSQLPALNGIPFALRQLGQRGLENPVVLSARLERIAELTSFNSPFEFSYCPLELAHSF